MNTPAERLLDNPVPLLQRSSTCRRKRTNWLRIKVSRRPSAVKVPTSNRFEATPAKGPLTSAKQSLPLVETPTQPQPDVDLNLSAKLYSSLRMLRTVLVKEAAEGVMAYHIFPNAVLQRISERIPRTTEELLETDGIGKAKVSKYGDRVLETIEATMKEYYTTDKNSSNSNESTDSAKRQREAAMHSNTKARSLIEEYGGTVGYPFIEADGYKVLLEAMLAAAEERKQKEINHAEGQTSMKEEDSGQKKQSREVTSLWIEVNEENDVGVLGNAPEVTRRSSARISSQADKSSMGKGKEKVEGCGQKKANVSLEKRKVNQSVVDPSDSNKKSKKCHDKLATAKSTLKDVEKRKTSVTKDSVMPQKGDGAEKNVMDIDLRQWTGPEDLFEPGIVESPRLATVQGPLDLIERGIVDCTENGNAVGEIGAGSGIGVDFAGLNAELARRDNTPVLSIGTDSVNLDSGLSPNSSVDLENHDIKNVSDEDLESSPVNNDLGNFDIVAATPQGGEAADENAFFPSNNQIVLVGAGSVVEGPTRTRHKRTGIAGAISPTGTIIVDVDSIPLTVDDTGETWRGFHIGAAKASLIRQLEKDIPDFFDNVQFVSGKRAVHDLKLLASNLSHFKYGQMHHLSIEKLRMMKDEFKDLERDGFRVDWAYKRIDQTVSLRLRAPVEREIDRLNGESARLQGELASLRAKAGELKAEIEDYKSKVKLAEEKLAIVEKNAFDKKTEIGAVDSALGLQTELLASLGIP